MKSEMGTFHFRKNFVVGLMCAVVYIAGCNTAAFADQSTFMGMVKSFQGATLQPSLVKTVEWLIIAVILIVFGIWRYKVNKHKRALGINLDADNYEFVPEFSNKQPVVSGGQKRTFARLNTRIEVAYCLYDKVQPPLRKDIHNGVVMNLSGGGLLLATNDYMKADSRLMLIFYFKPDTATYLLAKVIRLLNNEENDGYKYKAALQFEDIREGQRDSIIKWIFEQEREGIQSEIPDDDDDGDDSTTDQ